MTLRRHASVHGRWELAERLPCAFLAPHLVGTCRGYTESSPAPVRRREVPISQIVLILNLGSGFDIAPVGDPRTVSRLPRSFVAGLHSRSVIVESPGTAHCMQVDLTPPAARRLFGSPLSDLADRVVPLADLLGGEADRLETQLDAALGWESRLDLLEGWLCSRLDDAPAIPAAVEWAWQCLSRSAGRLAIGEVQRRIGWSRRHLVAQFREHIGAPPKLAARILRFERAVGMLDDPARPGWAEIAADCGYSDQGHLARDVRELAGMTPGELRRRSLPDGVGITVG
ncbi:MAG TPA: helix-turn-helix domain-containing protein [Geminicoccaceae bacterium]|nr:helix-turn-helix domain-containing protein [Geminicoccus sp.]HMU48229.1 helix-turn-helix domain-containing protein [Geminicoccaceae bacterium]